MGNSDARRSIVMCGRQSRFGSAHLDPLLSSSLNVILVVYPSAELCRKFSTTIAGTLSPTYKEQSLQLASTNLIHGSVSRIKQGIRLLLRALLNSDPGHLVKPRSRETAREIPSVVVDDVNSYEVLAHLRSLNPDWIVSAAFPQLFSDDLINVAQYGAINFHPSLLPKFRGAHPIYWAIRTGARTTGLSAHFMTKDIDQGDIIHQREMLVDANETYHSLYDKIVTAVPDFVLEVADLLVSAPSPRVVQSDADATYFRNDREIHHRIFWQLHDAEEVDRIVRASAGRSYFFWRGSRIQVLTATILAKCTQLTNGIIVPPGSVVDLESRGIVVKAVSGFVRIEACRKNNKLLRGEQIINELQPYLGELCT